MAALRWHQIYEKFTFPLTHHSWNLAKGYVDVSLYHDSHTHKKKPFIWGFQFTKGNFVEKTKLSIQVVYQYDYNYFDLGFWVNPDGSDSNKAFEVEFDPNDMDEGGCIFLKQPSDPTKVIAQ